MLYCGPMRAGRTAAAHGRRSALRNARAAAAAFAILWLAGAACGAPPPESAPQPPQRGQHRHLLIVLDGLRPDYVTPELMPNLPRCSARAASSSRITTRSTRP